MISCFFLYIFSNFARKSGFTASFFWVIKENDMTEPK